MYLWRAIDDEGEVPEVLLTSKRAALRLIRQPLKKHGVSSTIIVTDRYRAYGAAFNDIGLHVGHVADKRANNWIESSHVPVRRRERKRQGFKSARFGRHLTTASAHRLFRATASSDWRLATAVAA
jgi:putative transposase